MQINYELCSYIFAAIGFLLCVWCVVLHSKIYNLKNEISMLNYHVDFLQNANKSIGERNCEDLVKLAELQRKLNVANANKASLTNQVKSLKKKLAK